MVSSDDTTNDHRNVAATKCDNNDQAEKDFLKTKKKQSMNYLTLLILAEQQQQKLAALHFTAIHDYCFFFPSVLITLVSGILAILVKSTLVPDDKSETVIALIIAILAIISTLIQSLIKQLDYSGRAGFHNSCATALRKLNTYSKLGAREDTYNSIFKQLETGIQTRKSVFQTSVLETSVLETLSARATNLTEEENEHDGSKDDAKGSKEDTDSDDEPVAKTGTDDDANQEGDDTKGDDKKKDDEEHKKDDNGSISAQFRQAVDTCSSVVPIGISAAFHIMRTRLELVNKSTMVHKVHAKVDFSIVFPSLYHQLSHTIFTYKGFPFVLPEPEWAVDKTLRDWKKHLKSVPDNSADILGHLIERSDMIRHLGEETAPDDGAMV